MRFINNASSDENINLYVKLMLVGTNNRVGFWAKRDLVVGEELFFNYG